MYSGLESPAGSRKALRVKTTLKTETEIFSEVMLFSILLYQLDTGAYKYCKTERTFKERGKKTQGGFAGGMNEWASLSRFIIWS